MGELKKAFRPELINRIDEIIVFHQLSKDEIKQIIDLMLVRLQRQMAEQGVTLQLTDDAKDLLVEEGYDPAMGARPLRRAIQRLLEDPLSDELLRGTLTEGLVIVADRDGDKMRMERREAPAAPEVPEAVAVGADSDSDAE
jgi:ATP-dependent Clp protease ATP-binding subunit ClpC